MARMVDDEEVGMMSEHKQRDGDGLGVFSEQAPFEWAVGVKGEKAEQERRPGPDPNADCFDTIFCYHKDGRRRYPKVGGFYVLKQRVLKDGTVEIDYMVGPYWKVMVFCTSTLIIGVSAFLIFSYMPLHHISVQIAFPICSVLALVALWLTGTSNPGLVRRYRTREALPERATVAGATKWPWNDQVQSFRPPTSVYCRECDALIDGYDHVCPWTGTAIGKANMCFFYCFVSMVTVLMYFACFILIYGLIIEAKR